MRVTKNMPRPRPAAAAIAVLALLGLAACDQRTARADATPAPVAPPPAAPPDAGAAPAPSPAEVCADRWLEGRQLNPFGDPQGTSYLGGTPLFDERTGQKKSRLEHLFGKHEALKAACAGAGQK
jgi:hypothetical protein